jgi:predicted flap endonuclease-1-like 5' DNA nuclease
MGIFDRIMSSLRSLVGRDEAANGEPSTRETRVSVERDVRADDEREPAGEEAAERASGDDRTAEEPAAADTDASASTESLVEGEAADEPEEAAEPSEAVDVGDDAAAESSDAVGSTSTEETEPEAEADDAATDAVDDAVEEAEPADEEPDGADAAGGEPVDEVKGIGPAYAERLADAGVTTVADLAEADPEALADQIGVSDKRIARWIDRAREHLGA